jgi:hypothetical protein
MPLPGNHVGKQLLEATKRPVTSTMLLVLAGSLLETSRREEQGLIQPHRFD